MAYSLSPQWGVRPGSLEDDGARYLADTEAEPGHRDRVQAEMRYGLRRGTTQTTPFWNISSSAGGERTTSVGTRWALGDRWSAHVRGTQSDEGERHVDFGLAARW